MISQFFSLLCDVYFPDILNQNPYFQLKKKYCLWKVAGISEYGHKNFYPLNVDSVI